MSRRLLSDPMRRLPLAGLLPVVLFGCTASPYQDPKASRGTGSLREQAALHEFHHHAVDGGGR